MSVNFSSNVGYTPLRSNSNVNFARRNENMEAPKKSNTAKYVAAGVGLAAVAAAIVFRKPLGNALKNLMGKVKMPEVKMPDWSKMGENLKTSIEDFAKNAKVKADNVVGRAKTAVSEAAAKGGEAVSGFKAPNVGERLSKVLQGAKDYALKGWNFAKTYGKKAVDWVVNMFNRLFHKPVEVPPQIAGLLK